MPELLSPLVAQSYFEMYVVKGGIMMWVLVPTSLLALGIILQSFISLRQSIFFAPGDPELLSAMARKGDMKSIAVFARENPRRILSRIVSRIAEAAAPSEDLAAEHIHREVGRLFRSVHVLSVIANVAPFMGLLGTVLGLMTTFNQFTISPDPDVVQLSGGLYTAMTTTLWGLAIAVPAYVFYHYFRARLIRLEEDILPDVVFPLAAALARRAAPGSPRTEVAPPLLPPTEDTINPHAKTPEPSSPELRSTPRGTQHPSGEDTDEFIRKTQPSVTPGG